MSKSYKIIRNLCIYKMYMYDTCKYKISYTVRIVGIWRDEHILQIGQCARSHMLVRGTTLIIRPTLHNLETFAIATCIFHHRTLSFHNFFRARYDPASKFGKVCWSCKTRDWPEELLFLWTMALLLLRFPSGELLPDVPT